jgi:DNA mismatch endonuclease, patch repair protein
MSKIKGKDTKPELLVRKFLYAMGLRYRLHPKHLPGKPDIYLPKYKVVVEVRGCFWHGHDNCSLFIPPKTNAEWWTKKIKHTKNRDYINEMKLLSQKIRTIVVWECSLKGKSRTGTLETLYKEIIDL